MLNTSVVHCPLCAGKLGIKKRTILNRRGARKFKQQHPYLYCEPCDMGFRILKINPYAQAQFPFKDAMDEAEEGVDPSELPRDHPDFLPF
jgi:hypothetical protein